MATELREVSADELNTFLDEFNHQIFEMVSSTDMSERKGGILAIGEDCLLVAGIQCFLYCLQVFHGLTACINFYVFVCFATSELNWVGCWQHGDTYQSLCQLPTQSTAVA